MTTTFNPETITCAYVVEIDNDYGRYRLTLPYPQALIRAKEASNDGELSDFYHSCSCDYETMTAPYACRCCNCGERD